MIGIIMFEISLHEPGDSIRESLPQVSSRTVVVSAYVSHSRARGRGRHGEYATTHH